MNQHTPPFTFQSVAPTYEEVKGHRHQIIQPHKWDPAAVRLRGRCHPSHQPVKIAALQSINKVPFNVFSMNHQLVELTSDPNESETVLSSVSAAIEGRTFDKLLLFQMVSPTSAKEVFKKFVLGLETEKKTLTVTTQRGMRHAVHSRLLDRSHPSNQAVKIAALQSSKKFHSMC